MEVKYEYYMPFRTIAGIDKDGNLVFLEYEAPTSTKPSNLVRTNSVISYRTLRAFSLKKEYLERLPQSIKIKFKKYALVSVEYKKDGIVDVKILKETIYITRFTAMKKKSKVKDSYVKLMGL